MAMDISFLKKVRNRFKAKWNPEQALWIVFDSKTIKIHRVKTAEDCNVIYISEILGVGSMLNYINYKNKLQNYNIYKNELCK